MNLLSRDDFREQVFERDHHKCIYCGRPAVDAHHIMERKLFPDGGYYLDNGASLCSEHHIEAEQGVITVEEIRALAGIKTIILPPGLKVDAIYDKWGKEIDEQPKYRKYPRTFHFPWSEKATDDDKILSSLETFIGKEIVQTVKLDGENTSMYTDKIHARSIDGKFHPSQSWIRGFWATIAHEIPTGWRICGENVYAKHTIPYEGLETYFYVYSIWNEKNIALSWDETEEYATLLGLKMIPVLYRGVFNESVIKNNYVDTFNGNPMEGYVVRLASSFHYNEFSKSVAKFVSKNFVIADNEHWSQGKVIPNRLK